MFSITEKATKGYGEVLWGVTGLTALCQHGSREPEGWVGLCAAASLKNLHYTHYNPVSSVLLGSRVFLSSHSFDVFGSRVLSIHQDETLSLPVLSAFQFCKLIQP